MTPRNCPELGDSSGNLHRRKVRAVRSKEESQSLRQHFGDDWFATLIDADGEPPCEPPDDCNVCHLFTVQQPGESRAEWLVRITGGRESTPQRRAS